MDSILIKNILSRLNRYAFQSYVFDHFQMAYGKEFIHPFKQDPEQIFTRDLIDPFKGHNLDAVYITHYFPSDLANNPIDIRLDDPSLIRKIKMVRDSYKSQKESIYAYKHSGLDTVYFINNFSGYKEEDYVNNLIPKYEQITENNDFQIPIGVGNYDSFFDLEPDSSLSNFKEFMKMHSDGLCISINLNRVSVNKYSFEKHITGGVTQRDKAIYEPLFIPTHVDLKENLLKEFESLLNSDAVEARLEDFIATHYKLIFGPKYDRVETQLWLRFPELDISHKDRRLDLFIRNCVTNDWELFEIKRILNLTQTYRDVPVIAKEISYAIQQVKNYYRILSQDNVKKHFAANGIAYYEPTLHLVVGRDPQISHEQWRWLIASNNDVKIITYDELIKETQIRINDRFLFNK